MLLERTRKANHFSSTESTCRHTLASLLPSLREQVHLHLDPGPVMAELREGPGPEEKIRLWQRLKVVTISRCLAVVVGGAHLATMLRTQLNLLAGVLYEQEVRRGAGGRMAPALQEAFLASCHHLVTSGCRRLCREVEEVVAASSLPLTSRLSLQEVESTLTSLLASLRSREGGIFLSPAPYFVPPTPPHLQLEEQARLQELLADSLEVLASPDTRDVIVQACHQGVAHLADLASEHFSPPPLAQGDLEDSDSGFVSPASVSLPLPKLLPILAAMERVEEGDTDPWLALLQDSAALQTLGANVYEAFCESPQASPGLLSSIYQSATSMYWRVV